MERASHLVHISLGSNIGDRLAYLQKAIDAIYEEVGDVLCISGVYETPAWGFSSDDFYNACISVKTRYTPEQVLDILMGIEQELGRHRKEGEGYEARVIDLDVILSSCGVVATKKLKVPHPSMQERKFVLVPLEEIAAQELHPVFDKTIEVLLRETKDTAEIKKAKEQLINPKENFSFSDFSYLAIEGNIGAGKTTLATMIAAEFNGKQVLERFSDNPFLPKFYEDKERYAFPLEMSFLADRYRQFTEDSSQLDLFKDFMVSDYDIYKSLIFAQVTLPEEEFKLYRTLFTIMYKEVVKPDQYIYLYQNTDRLLQNIKNRGRTYEQNIPAAYLEKIHQGYIDFIKTQPDLTVKIIDVSAIDFVKNRKDYCWLLREIIRK